MSRPCDACIKKCGWELHKGGHYSRHIEFKDSDDRPLELELWENEYWHHCPNCGRRAKEE